MSTHHNTKYHITYISHDKPPKMLSQALKSVIPQNSNISLDEIIELTLEAERKLNVKVPPTNNKNYNKQCRQACCLEHVLRKHLHDTVVADLNIFANKIGMTKKQFENEHRKLSFRLDSIVTTHAKRSIEDEDILQELAVKLSIIIGDCTNITRKTSKSIKSIKSAMKAKKQKDDLAYWEGNKIRYIYACFYIIAVKEKNDLEKSHLCKIHKILERDFEDAIVFVGKWLDEVDHDHYKESNCVEMQSSDKSIITKKKDITMDDHDQYEESNRVEMQSDEKSINTEKEDIIMEDNDIHDDSIKLEIAKSSMSNESHKKQRIKEGPKTTKERKGYLKRKKKILKKAVSNMRNKYDDDMTEEDALASAADDILRKHGLL